MTVNYATADGTATTADGDYLAASGTLTFAPGVTTQTVTVTVNGDVRDEPNETFSSTSAGPDERHDPRRPGHRHDHQRRRRPTLSINDVAVAEGNAGRRRSASPSPLSAVSGQTVTVGYATADGTATTADGDYPAASGTLTFAPGVDDPDGHRDRERRREGRAERDLLGRT